MPEQRIISRDTGIEDSQYKWGFEFDIESEVAPRGLSEDIVRFISKKKKEPGWLLEWRLKAYKHWLGQGNDAAPKWANVQFEEIDFQDIIYYAAPKTGDDAPKSLDEVDPELIQAFDKLGIPLEEQKKLTGVAVDAVLDSVSVATTYQDMLKEAGVIFCSMSDAVREYPELVRKYLGSVVPYSDNFYASLNSAVFSDGSFCYVPPGVKCPIELMTYFRINEVDSGQFERTLIIADEGSYVSYLEGCTAPMRKTHQLHAAVVELVALKDAEIKYSTLQNWYPGDKEGNGGVYNFVTKRGAATRRPDRYYNFQQADTGTKMIHIGKNTKSTIISKGISAGKAQNTYRGQVSILPKAANARNFTQCDSLLIGDECGAHTIPYIEVRNPTAQMGHEATTSKVNDDQLFYLQQRGIDLEEANYMVINGFCRGIFKELPFEFAMEASQLLRVSLEGAVG